MQGIESVADVEQHQGVVLLFDMQLQVELVGGLDLGGATAGTLQVSFQRNLEQVLDLQSLKRIRNVTKETG